MTEQDNIVDELGADFQEGFVNIEPKPFAVQFPRGNYEFEVTNAYLGRSGSSGRKQLVANTTIIGAPEEAYCGQQYAKTWGLKDEQNLQWMLRDMIALDIKPPKNAADLLRVCNDLMGLKFRGTLVPNKEDPEQYPPNCYLNRGARVLESSKEGRF